MLRGVNVWYFSFIHSFVHFFSSNILLLLFLFISFWSCLATFSAYTSNDCLLMTDYGTKYVLLLVFIGSYKPIYTWICFAFLVAFIYFVRQALISRREFEKKCRVTFGIGQYKKKRSRYNCYRNRFVKKFYAWYDQRNPKYIQIYWLVFKQWQTAMWMCVCVFAVFIYKRHRWCHMWL